MRHAAVALLLAAAACTGGGTSPPSPTPSPIARGGTLRIATGTDLYAELDPQKAYDVQERELFRCCLLRTLLSYNGRPISEGGVELRPDLATQMPDVSADGLTWTFHIRSGIHFAPPLANREIVAGDFVRALEREATPNVSAGYPFYYSVIEGFDAYQKGEAGSIAGLEMPDEHTLIVRLTRPTGDLAYLFAMPATAPIPPDPRRPDAVLGIATDHDDGYGRFLVASGPYMLEGADALDVSAPESEQAPISGYAPERSVLVRNPSWSRSTDTLRPAYVDRIELTLGSSPERAATLVDDGRLNFNLDGRAARDQVAEYRDDPERADLVRTGELNATVFATINPAVPPFDDVHVRRAVSYAIDRDALVAKANASLALAWVAVTRATHIGPDGTQAGLLSAYDPYPYDPTAAAREMAASRYDRDGDGVCDADACRTVPAISLRDESPSSGVPILGRHLEAIGIHLDVRLLTGDRFFHALQPEKGNALAVGDNWLADFPSASQFGSALFGSAALPPGCCNSSLLGASRQQLRGWGYSVTYVPNVDGRIANCEAGVGASGQECWVEFDQYLMQEVVPLVPLFSPLEVFVLSPRVVAFSFDQSAYMPALDRIAVSPEGA